jgi:hypothetical protein
MEYLMLLETAAELAFGAGVLGVGLFGIYFSSAKNRIRNSAFSALGIAVLVFMFVRWGGVEEFWDLVRIIILSVAGGAVGAGVVGISFLAIVKGEKKEEVRE